MGGIEGLEFQGHIGLRVVYSLRVWSIPKTNCVPGSTSAHGGSGADQGISSLIDKVETQYSTHPDQRRQAVGTTATKPGRMEMKALIDDAHLVSIQVVEVGRFSEIFVSTTKHDRSGHSQNQIGFRLRG